MQQPGRFCFQTRPTILDSVDRIPYIPGIPAISPPRHLTPETVKRLIERYQKDSLKWHASVCAGKFRDSRVSIEPEDLIIRDELRVPLGVDKEAFIMVSDFWISKNAGAEAMAIIPEESHFITAEALGLAFLTDPNSNALYVHVEPGFTLTVYNVRNSSFCITVIFISALQLQDLAAKIAAGQPLPPVVERLRRAVASATPTSTRPNAHWIPQDDNQQASTPVDGDTSISISSNWKQVPDYLNTVNPTAAIDPASIPRTTLDDLFADQLYSQLPIEYNLQNYDLNDPDPLGLLGGGDDGAYTYTRPLPWSEDEASGTEQNGPSADNNSITPAMTNLEDTGRVNFGSNKTVEKE
ncbi:hypothetical protein EYC80_007229 [Monilinia laxa]|uniref:Uncharacterized protein n=1 Tax=Monilinia laxa TaxID=61186 RepID=A0A5N6K110_MONLA|nr:hypothetical protein EYC80_007229 [Monilinia laxa]